MSFPNSYFSPGINEKSRFRPGTKKEMQTQSRAIYRISNTEKLLQKSLRNRDLVYIRVVHYVTQYQCLSCPNTGIRSRVLRPAYCPWLGCVSLESRSGQALKDLAKVLWAFCMRTLNIKRVFCMHDLPVREPWRLHYCFIACCNNISTTTQ